MIRTKSPSPRCCSILSRQFDAAGPILANLLRPDRTERSGAADSSYNLVKPLQTSTTSSRPRSVSNLSTPDHNRPSIFIFKTEYRYIYIYIYSGLESGTRMARWKKSECLISKVNLPRGLIKTLGSWANQPSARHPTPANVATLRYFFTCARNIG